MDSKSEEPLPLRFPRIVEIGGRTYDLLKNKLEFLDLFTHPDREMRKEVVEVSLSIVSGLADEKFKLFDEGTIFYLLPSFKDPEQSIRALAIEAYRRARRKFTSPPNPKIVAEVIECLSDEEGYVRRNAIITYHDLIKDFPYLINEEAARVLGGLIMDCASEFQAFFPYELIVEKHPEFITQQGVTQLAEFIYIAMEELDEERVRGTYFKAIASRPEFVPESIPKIVKMLRETASYSGAHELPSSTVFAIYTVMDLPDRYFLPYIDQISRIAGNIEILEMMGSWIQQLELKRALLLLVDIMIAGRTTLTSNEFLRRWFRSADLHRVDYPPVEQSPRIFTLVVKGLGKIIVNVRSLPLHNYKGAQFDYQSSDYKGSYLLIDERVVQKFLSYQKEFATPVWFAVFPRRSPFRDFCWISLNYVLKNVPLVKNRYPLRHISLRECIYTRWYLGFPTLYQFKEMIDVTTKGELE